MKTISLILLTITAALAAGHASAKGDLDIYRVGGYATNSASCASIAGNRLCLVAGTLHVLDITDPAHPDLLGSVPGSYTWYDIVVQGDLAYGAGGTGMSVIDLSDPVSPKIVGDYFIADMPFQVAVTNAIACVAAGKLHIVNVGNPLSPQLLAVLDTGSSVQTVRISGSLAYVTDWNGLHVVDISQPTLPRIQGSFLVTNAAPSGIEVAGTNAFMSYYGGGLSVIDVSIPSAPKLTATYPAINVTRLHVASNLLFITDRGLSYDSDSKLLAYDATDPSHLRLVGRMILPPTARGLDCDQNGMVYVAVDSYGLAVVDATKAAQPQRLASHPTGSSAWAVRLDAGRAYVADVGGGLKIYDITTGTNLVELGKYDTLVGECRDVAVNSNLVCLLDGNLHFLSISNLSQPVELSLYASRSATSVTMEGTNAYVGYEKGAGVLMEVLDISKPATPRVLGTYARSVAVRGLTLASNCVFLAEGWDGFEIVDVSDPRHPSRTGGVASGDTWQVSVAGARAYVADGVYGLKIFDIADPGQPKLLGSCATEGRALGIHVQGDLAYIADDDRGLQVFYIADPQRPVRIGGNPLFGAEKVAVLNGLAYVATWSDGIVVLGQPQWAHLQPGPQTAGWVHFWLTGTAGLSAILQRSTNLLHWEDWMSEPLDVLPIEINDSSLLPSQFYRAVVR